MGEGLVETGPTAESVVVAGDQDSTAEFAQWAEAELGIPVVRTERRNLDGNVATWLVVTTLAAQTLPAVLDFLKSLIGRKRVTSITVGDTTIENPTPEMVSDLLASRSLAPPDENTSTPG